LLFFITHTHTHRAGAAKVTAQAINARYFAKYDQSLVDRLRSEVSGNYLRALVTYLTAPDPTGGLEDVIARGEAGEEEYRQAYFNVKESIADMDAFLLNFAASGMTTDVGLIIDVMCSKTKSELDAVDLAYRRMFDNKTLKGFVDGALGGDLAEFLGYMQMEEEEFDSYVLHKAFKGMGCDKDVVRLVVWCGVV
jgi:hypothetical protein